MTLERDHDRTHAPAAPTTADNDLAPGRSNRSNQLASPERPLVSALILRKARDANGVADGADTAVASASTSTGASLPAPLMRKFESSLGADLSSVRVHTGSESQAAAEAVGAKAYTVGNDIHFGAGHYDPTSHAGEHLIAHEVAHTVQQQSVGRVAQFKLEVSTPGDHLEVEADRAADAMVTGASATVTSATGLSRKVHRDQQVAPTVIAPSSLKDDMADASSDSQHADDKQYSWGSASLQTTDANGNPIENDKNPLVANAKRNGSIEALRELSSELDIIKPPMLAWKAAHASADAIKDSTGIDPETPTAYKAEFDKLKSSLDKGSKATGMSTVIGDLRAAQQARQKTALLQLKAAQKTLEGARAKFEKHRADLQLLAANDELKKNAADMQVVRDQIANCTKAITYTAKAVAMIAGGIGALEAGSVSLESDIPNDAISIPGTPALPKSVGTGADKVAGAGDVLTKFFEMTLFAGDIAKIKAQEAEINKHIQSLTTQGITKTTVAVSADLDAAVASAEAAKQNKEDADREFHNALIQAGRDFDQRNMTTAQVDKTTPNAMSHDGGVSMEGLMAVYSTMIKRGQSRGAFLDAAKGCPTLNLKDAKAIVQKVMDSGKPLKDPVAHGGLVAGTSSIDDPENAGPSGVDHIVAGSIGDQMKQGVAMALAHIQLATQHAPQEAATESQWAALVTAGTSGMIGNQV